MKKLKLSLISFFGLMKKNFIDPMKKSVADRRFWNLLALILVGLGVFAAALGLLYLVGMFIVAIWNAFLTVWNWLALNFWALVLAIALIIWGRVYIQEFFRKKREDREELRLQQEQLVNEEQNRFGAQNHIQVRQIIFDVLQDVGRLVNLEPPASLSSLDAPVHFAFQNGTLFFYYAVLKQGTVDCKKSLALLQDRLQQKALANELGLQPTSIVFRGVAYPIIMVDKVTDMGSYIELRIAWASEAYLSQRGSRGNFGGGIPSGRNDDNDF
ncbi:hypothetical protein [Faecalispora jeddahensis]|uniref:hypothetical protein n=1 Tax=Faecalispora jeddahensis TaxID=1414721 RepID=UPI0027B89A4E|nr:hypothetical protein [Faecalispora jeddahensis]